MPVRNESEDVETLSTDPIPESGSSSGRHRQT